MTHPRCNRQANLALALSKALACGVSAAALCMAGAPAMAQEASTGDEAAESDEAIIVTGSRLRRDGFETPTPVTVITSAELSAAAPGNMVDGLSQLPQFYNNQTPASLPNWFVRGGYGNLDLRGLGINRTLTLLNGRRIISSTAFGGVDINVFPEAMIRSVETVTGGASAAYGTDAVAGVVNFILDTDFAGVRAQVQAGATSRGDSENYEGSVSGGFELGDRGHVLVSYERFKQDGVHDYQGRDWYQGWGTVVGADGRLLTVPHVVSRNSTFDGLIISPNAALNGLAFNPDGSVSPFVTSSLFSGALGAPPARQSITDGGSGDDLGAEIQTVYPDVERESAFAYAEYDLTDNFKVYGQYIRGRNETFRYNTPRGSLQGTPTAITIFQDNAFLPDSVRDIMIANDIASFTFKRMGSFEDIGRDITQRDESTMNSATAGFTWELNTGGFLDGWKLDGYYQYGDNERKTYQVGLRVDRIHAAVDAVVDPESGEIVCRTTLFTGTIFPDCEPLNLFGRGNASPEAIDWVVGFEPGEQITTPLFFADTGFALGETDSYTSQEAKVNITTMRQHLFEFAADGRLFDGWGAGPITAAIGGSYRSEEIRQIVRDSTNRSSDHTNGHPVLCNTDPAAIASGLRGISQPDCTNTVGVQYSKVSNIQGEIEVKEAFAETQIPIFVDSALGAELTTSFAARYAEYSGSGGITAWKVGAEYTPFDGLRFRITQSRDVRAANLSERFDKTGGIVSITDPANPQLGIINVTRFSGGNPLVAPEEADTLTVGFVARPSFLDDLSVSVDWYRVDIAGAIGQLGSQAVVDRCFQGATELCSLVTRDSAGFLVLVGDLFVNINERVVSGVDLEIGYSREITLFGGDESFSARLFASWLDENSETLAGTTTIDRAGQTGFQQSDGIAYALPDFKWTANMTYTSGGFSTFLQGRYIGAGVNENKPPANATLVDNDVDAAFYVDARLAYRWEVGDDREIELFGVAANLLDEDPPVTPYYSPFAGYATQFNSQLFDALGRRYVAGARVAF